MITMIRKMQALLLLTLTGIVGGSLQDFQDVSNAKNSLALAKKIALEVQKPNEMTAQHTLTTFGILIKVIRTMTDDQIREVGEELYSKVESREDSGPQNYVAWIAFRDAVAQAGTKSTLVTIAHWIREHKVEGEEAAQLLSVLPKAVAYPDEDYLSFAFDLISNPLITEQEHLNSTAVHTFTTLLSLVQKNKFYTKQLHRRFNEEYLPYLNEQLNKSVLEGNSHKIQVYLRAISNIGHPKILHLLEPYLEGKQNISTFQRLVIVAALDRLAYNHPKSAQQVFYRIYKNTEESPELRVAAVMQLMKTNPSALILQRMAQFTNTEYNKQVNSAVKSAIESAAKLTGLHNHQLAENARSAVNLLAEWQYGYQYSKQYLKDHTTDNIIRSLKFASIQSEDSAIPNSVFIILDQVVAGLPQPRDKLVAMTSSIKELFNLLKNQYTTNSEFQEKGHNFEHLKFLSDFQSQWSIENISKMLNISYKVTDQVEGNLRISMLGIDRFFTFDNNTVHHIPKFLYDGASSLKNGKSFNYSKLLNKNANVIAFPTAIGLPFVYSFEEPSLISFGGESQLKTTPDLLNKSEVKIKVPTTFNLTTEIKIIYASKTQSTWGILAPFNHQQYLAGYDSDLHIHLPLRVNANVDIKNSKYEAELQPLDPSSYQKIFEYSTTIYTTKQGILTLSPPQTSEEALSIHTTQTQKFQSTIGQNISGFAFDLKIESEPRIFDHSYFIKGLNRLDIFLTILNHIKEHVIRPNTNFTISFNPEKTSSETVKFYLNYDRYSMGIGNRSSETEERNGAIPKSYSGKCHIRSKQFLSSVSSGLPGTTAEAIDISLEFLGQKNIHYIATAACGRDPAFAKTRALLFLSKNYTDQSGKNMQYLIAVDMTSKYPKVPLIHYRKAVDADPSSSISAMIHYGEGLKPDNKIIVKGKLEQSEEYLRHLKMNPTAHECERQMLKGNNILPSCRNVTARANLIDKYSIIATYNKLPEELKNITYNVYSALRETFYEEISEELSTDSSDGQVSLNIRFSPDLTNINASILSPLISANFNNLEIGETARAIMVIHPEYNVVQRLGQIAMRSQQFPTCAIDKTSVTTFDNGTYNIHLGKCWHVIVLSTPHYQSDFTIFSNLNSIRFGVLARDVSPHEREVMLILDEDIIMLEPYSGSAADYFIANGKKLVMVKNRSTVFADKNGATVVQGTKLSSGEIRLISSKYGFDIFYDGLRIKCQISNGYRKQVHGLCGDFSSEKLTDLTSSRNCMFLKPSQFIVSYALNCKEGDHEQHELHSSASCYFRTFKPTNAIFNQNSYHTGQKKNMTNHSNKIHRKGNYHSCSALRTLVIFRKGQKCFSKVPQLTCMRSCLETVPRAQRKIEFSCLPLNEVGLGRVFPTNIPNLTKAVNVTESVWMPLEC